MPVLADAYRFVFEYAGYWEIFLDYMLIIGIVVVVVLVVVLLKQKGTNQSNANAKSANKHANLRAQDEAEDEPETDEWEVQAEAPSDGLQSWEWEGDGNVDMSTASVSAQEVDPLTEYQVYKQFGYEDKAAASLAAYLNNLKTSAPEKLVNELIGLCLNIGDADLLAATLERHAALLSPDKLSEYIKAGLGIDPNHLGLRVLAESKLNWNMQEVARQIGEQTGLESSDSDGMSFASAAMEVTVDDAGREVKRLSKHSPLIIGRAEVGEMTEEEMSAVIGFVKPEKSAKLLKNQVDYETARRQYNKAIQKSEKPAGLIIDALKLDYQHADVNEFAAHLWRLYYSLGSNGRQVKERMLGWGYSLGQHEVFDNLEKSLTEQQVREIGLRQGYLQGSARQSKVKYRELVHRNDSILNESTSPAELALKEVESLLMYGQLDQAISTLEQAVLKYPQESQLYIMLFDLYERSEDWVKLEQFLRVLREKEANLPEEVILAISQLQQRIHRNSNK